MQILQSNMRSIQDTCHAAPKDRLTLFKLAPDKLALLGDRLARKHMVESPRAGEFLMAVCEEDHASLSKIGISLDVLSERLKSRILSPIATDKIISSRGIEQCPFAEVGSCDVSGLYSVSIALTKPELDAALRLSHGMVHGIIEHVFFGFPTAPSPSGLPGSISRARPLDLALILDLTDKETHARLTSEIYGDDITWRNRFWSIKEI